MEKGLLLLLPRRWWLPRRRAERYSGSRSGRSSEEGRRQAEAPTMLKRMGAQRKRVWPRLSCEERSSSSGSTSGTSISSMKPSLQLGHLIPTEASITDFTRHEHAWHQFLATSGSDIMMIHQRRVDFGGILDVLLKTQMIEESIPSMSTTEFEIEECPATTIEISSGLLPILCQ